MDYLNNNKDFKDFLDKVSDLTGDMNKETWRTNLRENVDLFKKTGWAAPALQDKELRKTAIMMGASPALQKQVDTLREIQDDPDFVLCGLSCNLEFLLNNSIQPKYCITVDADKSQGEFWDNIDMDKTKDITLIASTLAYPPMLRKWKGPLYFLALCTNEGYIRRKHKKLYGPINGTGSEFWSIMGQFNVMTAFVFMVLGCRTILFVGNEMSFKDKDSRYYVDRTDPRDTQPKGVHGDIYGNMVHTTTGLLALKLSLEYFLGEISGAGWFINCTEAGIFGVTKRYPNQRVPWIKQLTLKNGIAQARHIMRTGKPFYAESLSTISRLPISENRIGW